MYVAGAWVESESGARIDATSPATGEAIGSVPEGTREDAQRAIAAAMSTVRFRRMCGQSPHVLTTAPQAAPQLSW